MKNIEDLLKNSCSERIEIPSRIDYRINYTLKNLAKDKNKKFYFKKLSTIMASLILVLFSGLSVYAAFGGTINGENIFKWIGIKISNQQFNEYKENIGEQIYSKDGTNVTLLSTFYDGDLAILEFNISLSEKDKNYLKIGQNVVTEDYINDNSIKGGIDVIIDGKKLTAQESKKIQVEQHENETIDKIWFSINNKEVIDKNGNSYIEGNYNNNYITINDKEYYLRHNATQIVDKVSDYEYKVFQTYFLPQENYQNTDNLKLKMNNLEIISNKTQLGDTQKIIHLLDNYEVELKKNESIKNVNNLNITNSVSNNVKISHKINYIATSPIQTTIKISTQLDNVDYDDLVDSNNKSYIGQLYYEVYDENSNLLSSYKVETKRELIYSDGNTEEWEIDAATPSKYFENAKLELTQYLICEKSFGNLTIKTVNENKELLSELNISLED